MINTLKDILIFFDIIMFTIIFSVVPFILFLSPRRSELISVIEPSSQIAWDRSVSFYLMFWLADTAFLNLFDYLLPHRVSNGFHLCNICRVRGIDIDNKPFAELLVCLITKKFIEFIY